LAKKQRGIFNCLFVACNVREATSYTHGKYNKR
jgi:hypothetical protein